MHEDVYREMFAIEDRHWWYSGKHRIVQHLLRRYLPPAPQGRAKVADLGCGCGMMLHRLRQRYDVAGVDGSPSAIEFCRQRGVSAVLGRFPDGIDLPRESWDAVLMLDVLEHLEEDVATARTASELLKPGGILVVTVPAYKWLWSKWDEHHHHFRRYTRTGLKRLIDQTQLRIELLSYYNFWLFPLAAATRLAGNVVRSNSAVGSIRIPSAPVNSSFRTIFSSERKLLGRVNLPFGLSLIAVARKW
jgi:SAM-dependent methyltransferase